MLAMMLVVFQPSAANAHEGTAAFLAGKTYFAAGDALASELVELSESVARSLGIASDHAILVVLPKNGPSESAGLKPGDVIFSMYGQSVPKLSELAGVVMQAGRRDGVELGIWRRGEKLDLLVRLEGTSGAVRSGASTEQVIEAYKAIGKTFGMLEFPAIWAFTQYKLGESYWIRTEGRSEDNLEGAIAAYNSALKVLTPKAFPQEWARTKNDLALAYVDRVRGSRAENLDIAIRAYQEAMTVLTSEKFPREWAQIQNCLGLAYLDRIEGNREDNIDAAIDAYKATLTVLTKEAFPQDWARIQKHLGQAYGARLRGDRVANLEAAVKAYEAAVTLLFQTTTSTPPGASTHPPQGTSAKLDAKKSERESKAVAQMPAAEREPQPSVKEVRPSSQLAETSTQSPRKALPKQDSQADAKSKPISQPAGPGGHEQAVPGIVEAVQTESRRRDYEHPDQTSPAQIEESLQTKNQRARGEAQQQNASETKPGLEVRERKAKMKCNGSVVWVDQQRNVYRPGTPGYGRRPGRFACEIASSLR